MLQWRLRKTAIRRHAGFESFSARYIPLTDNIYHSVRELREKPPLADVYIAGSDQIWNTGFPNGTDAAYYLDFGAKDMRRISYAASFATRSLMNGTETFVKGHLCAFDAISVREKSGLDILFSMNYQGKVVVDPVFLLTADNWNEVADLSHIEEAYILIYDFMQSKTVMDIAVRLSRLHHCKIYSVGSHRLDYADKNFVYAGCELFIKLIKDAECVVSNSFHGSVFALIYKRNFFVVEREDGLNDRLTDLLERLNLQSRLVGGGVSDAALKEDIPYTLVDKILDLQIKESQEYLRENIQSLHRHPE